MAVDIMPMPPTNVSNKAQQFYSLQIPTTHKFLRMREKILHNTLKWKKNCKNLIINIWLLTYYQCHIEIFLEKDTNPQITDFIVHKFLEMNIPTLYNSS